MHSLRTFSVLTVTQVFSLIGSEMISLPMVGGRQRLPRFEAIYADQKLPAYTPQADRK